MTHNKHNNKYNLQGFFALSSEFIECLEFLNNYSRDKNGLEQKGDGSETKP